MPELPEVETVRSGLDKLILDKKINSVKSDNQKSFPNDKICVEEFLLGSRITSLNRRAKVLFINLSTQYSLMIHLKMTGQLVFIGKHRFGAGHPNSSLVDRLPDRSTRVIIEFSDKSRLFFNDQRKFGWMKLLPSSLIAEDPFISRLGPEPLSKNFTAELFTKQLSRRSRSTIKAAILDQSVLAGIGNIYADESLWMARIDPRTKVQDISKQRISKLHNSIIEVLKLSIDKGGSTDRNYVNAEGKKGSYIQFAKVFRREGQQCFRCGTTIDKIRVASRGTHICKNCQKA